VSFSNKSLQFFPYASSAEWLHALFPVLVFAEKSKYTKARQEKAHSTTGSLHLHNVLMVLVESP
jgi:hypothetical protein